MLAYRKTWVLMLATAAFVVVASAACSLHYHQQADSQTLDIEVMRPTSAAGSADQVNPKR